MQWPICAASAHMHILTLVVTGAIANRVSGLSVVTSKSSDAKKRNYSYVRLCITAGDRKPFDLS